MLATLASGQGFFHPTAFKTRVLNNALTIVPNKRQNIFKSFLAFYAPILFTLCFSFSFSLSANALTSGDYVDANIVSPNDTDSYTFSMAAGENVQLRAVDLSNNSFIPRITLYGPDGSYLTFNQGYTVAVINYSATISGDYTVSVSHGATSQINANYRLYYSKLPSANDGGTLVNGGKISSLIDIGDIDAYTFDAALGENIQIRVADTSGGSLIPRITLFAPDGSYITFNQGYTVSVINYAATETGTYTVTVADYSGGFASSGSYDIYFAHIPSVNDGGELINGGKISSELLLGDIDAYTFDAALGENIQIRVADTSGGSLIPRITLFAPDGSYITFNQGYTVSVINYAATETGTYTVTVADYSGGYSSTGTYNIYFSHLPGANDGGELINGGRIAAELALGDIDTFTFDALTGQNIQIRVADTSGSSLIPRITLFAPDGSYITFNQGYTVSAINYAAASTGTYSVTVADYSGGFASTGSYNIYFARAPGANDGGTLSPWVAKSSTIELGDIDAYTFAALPSELITIDATDTSGGSFIPRITVFNPLGNYVTFNQGYTSASISFSPSMPGLYTVTIADYSGGFAATGDYSIHYSGSLLP